MKKEVSILIPHYKTLEMTRLCLNMIRRHTDLDRVEVIVIDNGSSDKSTKYLQELDWITLLIREKVVDESGAQSHANALDDALERVTTPFFLSIHTDTFFINPGWLDFLLEKFKYDDNMAGIGSWKLEVNPLYKRILKYIETFWQLKIWYPILGKGAGSIAGAGNNHYYLRSHCALYKTEIIREYGLGFSDGGQVAGKIMHQTLLDKGFEMNFLDSNELSKYIRHLNHATVILNPELHRGGVAKPRQVRRIKKELKEIESVLGR